MHDRFDDNWQRIGAHRYLFEAPDLLRSRPVGAISRDELAASLDVIERHACAGPLFWVVDLKHLGGLAPDARKLLAQRDARAFLRAIVLVGGSFHQRVLATLAIRAVRLFWRHRTHVPFAFFADEPAALAWIEAERRAPSAAGARADAPAA